MRPFPKTIWLLSTPNRRSSPANALAIGLLKGRTVTYRAGLPKPATATATLASPPPKVATKRGDCRNRSKPGGASRSMVSPRVTTSLDMKHNDKKAGTPTGKAVLYVRFLYYGGSCITVSLFQKKPHRGAGW